MGRDLLHWRQAWIFRRRVVAILAFAAISFAVRAEAQDNGMEITDFKAQLDHFPPPNETKIKTLLEGEKAQYIGDGKLVLLTEARLTTFRTNGTVEMAAATPHCTFDQARQIVSSPESLQVQSGDGKFLLQGRGFLLDQTNSALWVSNDVHTVSREGLPQLDQTNPRANEPSAQGPLEVFSHTLFYNRDTGVALYQGAVRVVSTNLLMTTKNLRLDLAPDNNSLKTINADGNVVIDYDAIHASAEKAFYDAATDKMRLTGHPSWTMGAREGRGNELVLDRANGVFHAMDGAYLKLPVSSDATNIFATPGSAGPGAGWTNSFIEITCDTYDLRTNQAKFYGHVEAAKLANGQLAGKINCGILTIHYSDSNHVQDAVAENNVVVEQNDSVMRAENAVFSGTNSIVEFTGHPSWTSGEREGSGDRLVVNTASDEMQALGHARVRLPASENAISGLSTGSTNSVKVATNQFLNISSDTYILAPTSGVFRGAVRVQGPELNLACDNLRINRTQSGEAESRRAEAEKNVIADFIKDGKPYHVTAGRMFYTYDAKNGATNELLKLVDHPNVLFADGTPMTGDEITWNSKENLWRVTNVKTSIEQTNLPNLLGGSERTRTNSPSTNAVGSNKAGRLK